MFHTRGQATSRTPTTRASATGRPRSILLALALLAAVAAPLAGAAPSAAQAATVRLELTPARALTEVGRPIRYTAELVTTNNRRRDVTSRTILHSSGPAPCHQGTVIRGQLSCDDNGVFKVTGVFGNPAITSEAAELEVVNGRVPPAFESVPDPSPSGSDVTVQGLTGSCGQEGILSSRELDVAQQVAGRFTATFRIPPGIPPGSYPLTLGVTCDRQLQQAMATIVVSDQQPVAVDDPNERTERDRAVDIDVMKNDVHPVAARLQVLPEPTPQGSAVVQPNGTIRYTPGRGVTGTDRFRYDYCKPILNVTAAAACAPAVVTVDVRPPPEIRTVVANPTPPNKEVVVTGTTGSCQEGMLTLLIPPPGGDVPVAVTASQDGTFTARLKVPGGTFVGAYGLVLRVDCDRQARLVRQTLRVDNQPPDAVDDPASTPRDTPVTIEVTGNDTDPDGDDGYATSLKAAKPANGTTEVLSGDRVRYTPDKGFVGVDHFRYRLCDVVDAAGATDCGAATVTVAVSAPPPKAVDDPASTVRDRPVRIDVTGNDTDPDIAKLRVLRPASPGAKAERQPDGSVRYSPEPGFTGTDTFRYDYCGGSVGVNAAAQGACSSATVTVTVTAMPVISSVRPGSTAPGRTVEVDGNTGSCNRTGTLTLQGTGAVATVAAAQDGGFTVRLTVPPGTFPGTYRLELRVDCNGRAQRADRSLTVTNRAPVANDDTVTTTRDHPVSVEVTANDGDPDGPDGYRTLVLPSRPPSSGTAEVQPDNRILYTPGSGFIGEDRFSYSLCDDVLNTNGTADCDSATVTVTVTDTPVISSVAPGATPPGRPVEVVGNTGSCNRSGTLVFHGTVDIPMVVAGDETGGFASSLTVPAGTFPGSYRLELRVDCNGRPQLAEAGLTVTNQPPAPLDDQTSTLLDTPVAIEVTANDRDPDDPDGYATLVLVSSPPSHGTAEVQADNQVRYTPDEGFSGQDRFGYSLCDDVLNAGGTADCGAATVTVRVDPRACVPPAGASPPLHVDPVNGAGGTRLRVTARVDRGLAACPLRLLLGGIPLGPDIRVRSDGSISGEREVPGDARPGPMSLRLTTLTAQTVAETPFEVAPVPSPAGLSLPLRLLVGAGALLAGALARAAFRRWRPSRQERRAGELPDDIWAEPHTNPVEVAVEPAHDTTRTFSVRLEPHPDPGNQTLREVT